MSDSLEVPLLTAVELDERWDVGLWCERRAKCNAPRGERDIESGRATQRSPFSELFLQALKDPLLIVLVFASLVSCTVGLFSETGWSEGLAVFCLVIFIAFVTATNDFLQAREFHRTIGESQLANCTVVRQELETEIPVTELVAGDVIRIKTGMSVPADGDWRHLPSPPEAVPASDADGRPQAWLCEGRTEPLGGVLCEAYGLKVDESSVTGESGLVEKRAEQKRTEHGQPFLYSGTKVEEGTGTMLACVVSSDALYSF